MLIVAIAVVVAVVIVIMIVIVVVMMRIIQSTIKTSSNLRPIRNHFENRAEFLINELKIGETRTSDGSLNDVVAEGVLHDSAQAVDVVVVQFLDQSVLGLLVREDEELLDDVGGELVAGQLEDLTLDRVPDKRDSFLTGSSVEEVLDDVVGEGVRSEDGDVAGDGGNEAGAVLLDAVIEGALHNDASLLGLGDFGALVDEDGGEEVTVDGLHDGLDETPGVEGVDAEGEGKELIFGDALADLEGGVTGDGVEEDTDDVSCVGI